MVGSIAQNPKPAEPTSDQKVVQQRSREKPKSPVKRKENIVRQLSCKIKGKAKFDTRDGIITVDERYGVQRCVGTGAYGHVFSAKDAMTTKKVAIKWIHKAFQDAIDAKRVLREIKILKFLEHENIIELLDI